MLAGILLAVAIGVEVAATALLPKAQGFPAPFWTVAVVAGYALSIWLLTVVVRTMPVSVAYAIWAGAGTAVTVSTAPPSGSWQRREDPGAATRVQ